MIPITDVTCIMKSYSNHDFTQAAVWALRRYYPDIRVIFADGHPDNPFHPGWLDDKPGIPNTELVWIPGASCEEVQNAAMGLVETPYVLLMDNDTKVIGKDALPLCLEAFEDDRCAASGWYGLKVKDWDTCTAYVGTEFTDHMELDATQAAFSVHEVYSYRSVGGMPKAPFWPTVPVELWKDVKPTPGFGGDLTLCRRYREYGYKVISPRASVPILHWGQAVEWMPNAKGQTAFDQWWFANTHHIRCNPLNSWREKEAKR